MPYPKFTKIIINYFLSQHRSLAKKKHSYINTIKDDGVLSRLKFVSKGEEPEVYGLPIPNTMLTDEIKNSKAYQMYVTLSTSLVDPKISRGKSISITKAEEQKEARRVHETHEPFVTKKPTSVEESDESNDEPANRPTGRRRL
nr:hypothetical protein [Tanacetum cinerariifolium]